MDSESLLDAAAERQHGNLRITDMQKELRQILDGVTAALGRPAHSATELRLAAGDPSLPLADRLSELASLAETLREVDALNAQLGRRALAVVSGYLSAVRPEAKTYGRSGSLDPATTPRRNTSRHA